MIRRCAWLIAAVFSFSACGAEGQDAVVSSDLDRTGSTADNDSWSPLKIRTAAASLGAIPSGESP